MVYLPAALVCLAGWFLSEDHPVRGALLLGAAGLWIVAMDLRASMTR